MIDKKKIAERVNAMLNNYKGQYEIVAELNDKTDFLIITNMDDEKIYSYDIYDVKTEEDEKELLSEIKRDLLKANIVCNMTIALLDNTEIDVTIHLAKKLTPFEIINSLFIENHETIILQDMNDKNIVWFIKVKEIEKINIIDIIEREV